MAFWGNKFAAELAELVVLLGWYLKRPSWNLGKFLSYFWNPPPFQVDMKTSVKRWKYFDTEETYQDKYLQISLKHNFQIQMFSSIEN